MQLLTPTAVAKYTSVFQFEAAAFLSSLYRDTQGGLKPINSAKAAGRFALKYVLVPRSSSRF